MNTVMSFVYKSLFPINMYVCDSIFPFVLQDTKDKPLKKGKVDLESRRKTTTITMLEAVFEQLEAAFNTGHSIDEVLILFGGTAVSPKETYMVKLPTAMYEGKLLSLQQAKSCLFRQIVTSPCWVDVPEIRATKMHILLHAARDEELTQIGLRPKLTFKRPTKGRFFSINVGCKCTVVSPELSRVDDSAFEISGVEPLDLSDAEFMQNHTSDRINMRSSNSVSLNHMDTNADSPDDFIWYQLPTIIQGLKCKLKP